MISHQCQDCDHQFAVPGQNDLAVAPAAQCPNCHSYRTQPAGIPDEANDAVHGIGAMPGQDQQDDMSGNPLQEGILGGDGGDGGWKNRSVRDESFASSYRHGQFPSMFETPEFETTGLLAPPDLYRTGLEAEHEQRAGIQLPKGITDNLHAALGNSGAWVENPHENGQLRPYNQYWKSIRPQYMHPGSLQIGVADPTMAEIINHVAQTDDLTPLYQYRGIQSTAKLVIAAEVLAPLAEDALGALMGSAGAGSAEVGTGLAGTVGGDVGGLVPGGAGVGAEVGSAIPAMADDTAAAAGAGATEAASGARSIGGMMKNILTRPTTMGGNLLMNGLGHGLNYVDDLLGFGSGQNGGGGTNLQPETHDLSFYSALHWASDEDSLHPDSHDEIPKNDDGDAKQKSDGNSHEWQRDLSVNDLGGTDHSPSFDPGGVAVKRFIALAPLLHQYMTSGEDASEDQLVQGLHEALEAEIPGYLDHADDQAGQRLHHQITLILDPSGDAAPKAEADGPHPERNEPDHTDENSGGKHESRVASLHGEAADFLPDFTVELPSLRGAAIAPYSDRDLAQGVIRGPLYPEEEMLHSENWPKGNPEVCPHCGHFGKMSLGVCPGCGREVYPDGGLQEQAMSYQARTADTQGPQSPEQIKAVQEWLLQHGSELNLEGDELLQTVLSVPTNPLEFADILAKIQQAEPPPAPPQDAMSAQPPMPAQEQAPPGETMPVPPMQGGQQMMGAARQAADSVASECPKCGSHTTGVIDEDGTSQCHACKHIFKTDDLHPVKINSTSAHLADAHDPIQEPMQGVPMSDQQPGQPDLDQHPGHGHTWVDSAGAPLQVGQEYEMRSAKYEIPDRVRIEAVKPTSIHYTLTGEFGIEHSTELTKEEADLEGLSFEPTTGHGEAGAEDDGSLEANNDDNTAYTGSPEHTDLSAPHGLVSASVRDSGVHEQRNPQLAWLTEGMRTAGANYTPMEQRELIDELGDARNAQSLRLDGTHYVSGDADEFLFGW